jgi:hypothetical protein
MSKRLITALTATAALGGGLLSGCAAGAPTPLAYADTEVSREVDFTFVAYRDDFKVSEVGTKGPSLGDRYIEFGEVQQHGDRVGTHGDECTIVQVADNRLCYACLSIVRLADGQLRLEGLVRTPIGEPTYRMAVTGGTGKYAGATGQVRVTGTGSLSDGQLFEVTLL